MRLEVSGLSEVSSDTFEAHLIKARKWKSIIHIGDIVLSYTQIEIKE